MDITLIPGKLNGTIDARPSTVDSLLHATAQSLVLHLVKTGAAAKEVQQNPTDFLRQPEYWSEDLDDIQCCFSNLAEDAPTLNCGSSRRAFYMMLPIAAAVKSKVSFVGSADYPNSQILPLTEVLKPHDVRFSKGTLKIKRRDRNRFHEICTLSGRLSYGAFSLTGREDPAFLTGLLFGLPLLNGNSSVRMTTMMESTELPDMAIAVLKQYGINIERTFNEYGYPEYVIPGNQTYRIPEDINIEGDWAKASFWLGCGALGGNVTVRGLSADSCQTARQILDKLRSLGAATGMGDGGASVIAGPLNGCNINASRISELVPILSVLMSTARGTSMLTGIESQQYAAVYRVLEAFGADISNGGSGFSFTGKAILTGGEIDTADDPIIGMTAIAAASLCRMPVTVRNAGIINKKYPGFFDDLKALGGKIER